MKTLRSDSNTSWFPRISQDISHEIKQMSIYGLNNCAISFLFLSLCRVLPKSHVKQSFSSKIKHHLLSKKNQNCTKKKLVKSTDFPLVLYLQKQKSENDKFEVILVPGSVAHKKHKKLDKQRRNFIRNCELVFQPSSFYHKFFFSSL